MHTVLHVQYVVYSYVYMIEKVYMCTHTSYVSSSGFDAAWNLRMNLIHAMLQVPYVIGVQRTLRAHKHTYIHTHQRFQTRRCLT